jgi:hypothetical protein
MPRVDTTVEARRVEVARRYLRGEMQSEIAESFGISQAQISYDLKAIRAAWLQSAIRDFNAARAEELAKIDQVEGEYWQAWERSKKDKETENLEGDGTLDQATRKPKVTKITKRKEGQSGNPAYLQGILTCIERRCKILGLDAPTRFNINWDELTPEQEERLAKGEAPEKVLSA